MTTVWKSAPLAALMACALLSPKAAIAQDQRFRASFAPAVATVSDDAELALGGTFGYRVSKGLWFEGELTWLDAGASRDRAIAFDDFPTTFVGYTTVFRDGRGGTSRGTLPVFPGQPGQPGLPIGPILPGGITDLRASVDGSTIIGTLGVRWELPVETTRVRPYVSGGIGVNNTDQRFRLAASSILPAFDESTSSTGPAFSAGVGAAIRVGGPFWADVDAKYFRLSRDRDIMRLGGGIAFRF